MRSRGWTCRSLAWLVLVLLAGSVLGCAQTQPTLVVTVGGMGFSQMYDLRVAVKAQCPEAKVVSAGMWDAYKTDLRKKGLLDGLHQRVS